MTSQLILSVCCGLLVLLTQAAVPTPTRPAPCGKWLEGRAPVDEALQVAFESALTQMPSPWTVTIDIHESPSQRLYRRLLHLTRVDTKATVVIEYVQTPEAAADKLQCDMSVLQIPAYRPTDRIGDEAYLNHGETGRLHADSSGLQKLQAIPTDPTRDWPALLFRAGSVAFSVSVERGAQPVATAREIAAVLVAVTKHASR